MGTCESNAKEKRIIELKKGICLFIKKIINPIIYYHYFYINNIYIPFLITSINNTKEENDKILLYEEYYMISLNKLKEKIEYEKYEYVFFEFEEKLIPKIPSIFPINNKILMNEKNEVSIGNYAYLLYKSNNSKDYTKYKFIITEKNKKNDKTFEYKCVEDNEINSYYNLIVDSESYIIGVKLENKCGISLKPLFKEFLELYKKKYYEINNNNNLMTNNTNINKKYIIPLFLALANIEKLKDIDDNSFEIKENNIIYYIIKFMKYYYRNEILTAKEFINEFANLYNEENINFKKLIDFISYKSYLKFLIDEISKTNIFIQNQNIIQKKLFIIYENEEKCNDINKQYISNSMYLYSENKECDNLQKLINEWENEEKEKCPKCLNNHFIKRKIIYWPEILIIILNEKNKIKDIDELKIQQYQKEYKLKCCIEENSENNNFNVFYKEQNKWYMIKNDDLLNKIEVKNKINPCVLFYENINNRHYSFESQNNERIRFNSNNNCSNGGNFNLNIGNENKNILKNNISFNNKNPTLINNSNKLNKPISNAPFSKIIFPNSIYSNKPYNQPSNTPLNITNNLYLIRPNNLQYPSNNGFSNIKHIPYSNNNENAKNIANKTNYYNNLYYNNSNSNNHRSITPTPTPIPIPNNKDSQTNQNLDINKIISTNKNYINAPNLNNNKNSIYVANYNQNIKPYGESKICLFRHKNNLDINNINLNAKNDYTKINNNNSIYDDENEKEISLYFIFNNGKELYLDVKKSWTFLEVITQLKDKYLWLEDNIKIREYQFKGKAISENLTVKNIGLEDESIIKIIESD